MHEASISLPKNKTRSYIELKNIAFRELQRKNSISQNKSSTYINQSTLDQRNGNISDYLRNLPNLNNKSIYNPDNTSPNIQKNSIINSETYKSPVPLKLKLFNKKVNMFKIKLPKSTEKRVTNFRKNLTKYNIIKPKINSRINNYFNESKKNEVNNLQSKTEKIQKTIDNDYSYLMKKLDNWDKDHCIKNNKDFFSLYDTLSTYYKKNNLYEEENNLNFADNIVRQKINYNKYKENKTNKDFENEPKNDNANKKIKSNEESNMNEQNKGAFLNSLIRNNLNKDTPKNKIDLNNKMMKERLDYENQLHNELIFVNNMLYNRKFVKKEKNKELNKVFIQLDKLRQEYEQKKNKCLKKFYSLLEQANLEYNNLVYEKHNEAKKLQENKNLSDHLKKLEKLKAKQMIASELKDLEFMHQNKISSIDSEKKKEIDEIKKEYNIQFEEIEKRKKLLETEIKIINNELNYYRNINEELQKEFRLYYLDILKKGNDCRKDGLVWVVKNLLELKINLEYHHFPKYLSHEQINYLKSLARLILEENELKIILKVLKKKQKDNRDNENIEYMNLFETLTNKQYNKYKDEKINKEKKEIKEKKRYEEEIMIIKKEIDKKFSKVYKNNEEVLKVFLGKSLEEEKLQNILYYIKKALYNDENIFQYENKTSLIDAFIGKTKNKDLFELIIKITKRLYEIEQKMKNMIKKEKENYLEYYNNIKGIRSQSINYVYHKEMIKRCLFGNKIEL